MQKKNQDQRVNGVIREKKLRSNQSNSCLLTPKNDIKKKSVFKEKEININISRDINLNKSKRMSRDKLHKSIERLSSNRNISQNKGHKKNIIDESTANLNSLIKK